jgi:very-short-patch-repair endonuclease
MATPTPTTRERRLAAELQILHDKGRIPPFQQQYLIGPYYADFAFPDQKIIIEIEGYGPHTAEHQHERDCIRHNFLEARGWRLIRLSNKQVDRDLVNAAYYIMHRLDDLATTKQDTKSSTTIEENLHSTEPASPKLMQRNIEVIPRPISTLSSKIEWSHPLSDLSQERLFRLRNYYIREAEQEQDEATCEFLVRCAQNVNHQISEAFNHKTHHETDLEKAVQEELAKRRWNYLRKVCVKLPGDRLQCRYIGFYVPRRRLFIEVMKSSDDVREKWFEEKIALYQKNNILCLLIWPKDRDHIPEILDMAMRKRLELPEIWRTI